MRPQILVSVRVDATPMRAFEAFVRDIDRWWQPNDLFRFDRESPDGKLAIDGRLGGRFTQTAADGTIFEIGTVLAFEPGRRLELTWRQASFAPAQTTQVRVTFEAVGTQTRVTVEHGGWEAIPQDHAARHGFPDGAYVQRHAEWWDTLLRGLRRELSARV